MESIDRIIFEVLTTRREVNLPGVGSLAVRRIPARLTGRRRLSPPYSRVEFSPAPISGAPSLVDLLKERGKQDAEQIYGAWLRSHALDGDRPPARIDIAGVGHIEGRRLHPEERLAEILNPLPLTDIRLKPRLRAGWVAIPAAIVLVGAAAAFLLTRPTPEERRQKYWERMARGVERRESPGFLPERRQTAPPADTIPEKGRQGDLPDTLSAANPPSPASTADVEYPLYHVVFGLYSTRANAETFIGKLRADEPSTQLEFTIIPTDKGKFIVSGHASADRLEAIARRRELAAKYPDIWVYTQEK